MTTTELTELQKQMKALTEVKCPMAVTSPGMRLSDCELCNGSGLKREYDCLRLECVHLDDEYAGRCPACHGARWHVLPAERAHEAVGKLLDMLLWFKMDKSHIRLRLSLPEGSKRGSSYYQGIVGNLLFALCEAEGVSDG